jgi:hypothetical protein
MKNESRIELTPYARMLVEREGRPGLTAFGRLLGESCIELQVPGINEIASKGMRAINKNFTSFKK